MSRESTPASLLGALALTGSPTSSNPEMPVTTRGMLSQSNRNLFASQQASSGTAAGSSRPARAPARERIPARSRGRVTHSRLPDRRSTRNRPANHESEDGGDDDDESDGEGGPEQNDGQAVNEIMSTFADMYPTPREFAVINPRDTRNSIQT